MLAKLAMSLGVSARRPSAILTTDTYRIAAADQLKAFAAILGLPIQVVESAGGLSRALLEQRQRELILIDTPGFSPKDWECAQEWAEMLSANPEVEVHLTLPATMRSSDLRDCARKWAIFHPSRLVFTRLDETSAYGGCVAAAADSGLPISWLGTGQAVPEDVEPATAARVLGSFSPGSFSLVQRKARVAAA
jgi:flagellar biosynthesis protein FlhF